MAVYVCIVTAEFCLMYLLKFTELLCLNLSIWIITNFKARLFQQGDQRIVDVNYFIKFELGYKMVLKKRLMTKNW